MTTTTCAKCGSQTSNPYLVLTPWQQGDTDTRDMTDAELVADGAVWACLGCVNG